MSNKPKIDNAQDGEISEWRKAATTFEDAPPGEAEFYLEHGFEIERAEDYLTEEEIAAALKK